MNNVKVSVIIPIYNGAEFLEKNLLVAAKQELKEIEFICVDDMSSDNSLDILKAFKAVYPDKFVVLSSQRNRGPGGARNIGITYAKGEYISFMDQDDFMHPSMLKEMYRKAKEGNYDVVSCGYIDGKNNKLNYPLEINDTVDDEKRIFMMGGILYIWNKIYKRELINNLSMYFRENVMNDDTDFLAEVAAKAEKVGAIGNCFYKYCDNTDSLTRKEFVDIPKQLRECKSLFDSLKNRIYAAGKANIYFRMIEKILNVYIKGILKFIFDEETVSREYFDEYMDIFSEYIEYAQKFRLPESKRVDEIAFCMISADKDKSFENLVELKKAVLNYYSESKQ